MDNLEYLRQCFADPVMFDTQEFRQWIADPDNHKLYRKALVRREALSRGYADEINLNALWFKFAMRNDIALRPKRNNVFRRTVIWGGVVAAIAIVAVLIVRQTMPEQKITIAKSSVIITLDDGQNIPLDSSDADKILKQEGMEITSDGIVVVKNTDLTHNPIHSIYVPFNQTLGIVLSDGTEVLLNGGTRISYPQRFSDAERTVKLYGEAYFKVVHHAGRPFIVAHDSIRTCVLGTEFNFRCYPSETVNITLVEGSVKVFSRNNEVTVARGENVAVYSDGVMSVTQVDVCNYTAWTEGYFYFDYASLADIVTDIARWYGLEVEYSNEKLKSLHFHFNARRDSDIEDVLSLLSGMENVNATLKKGKILIN